jgi:hypothetical protein
MPKKRRASRGTPRLKSIRKASPNVSQEQASEMKTSSEQKPVQGPDAFADLQAPDHVMSQAAVLLLIGSHLRGDAAATQARVEASMGFMKSSTNIAAAEALPADDIQQLGFPTLQLGSPRFRPEQMQKLGVRFATLVAQPAAGDVRVASKNLSQVAGAFYRDANPETAAALLEISLRHPNELVRVAAAASYFEVAANPQGAIQVLEHGLRSRDLLIRDVAAYALANVDPRNPELAKVVLARKLPSKRKPSHTSTIVHGTWARGSSWWQPPGGNFWQYLHNNVDPSLYGASDRFEWTGGYSDAARALAGTDLGAWVQQHSLSGLDLFTHSHGGSVAMLANQGGMKVGRMALLSCPVHWPKYAPDFSRVNKVVSVRVHLDLVILADRGGQKFQDSRIQENVLPIWFDHFATHDPGNWQKYNVPGML